MYLLFYSGRSVLKYPANGYFVDIGSGWDLNANFVRTLEFQINQPSGRIQPEVEPTDNNNCIYVDPNASPDPTPLVMIHGLGTGSSIWLLNFDYIIEHSNRRIYALDLLGFGRSSRPIFELNGDVEWQLVYAIERWRKAVNLDRKFILMGHGFGAYLCLSYALHFPKHVAHLILLDPWGIPSQQQSLQTRSTSHYPLPYWVTLVNHYILQKFSPLRWLKMAGPWGQQLLSTFRTDLKQKYEQLIGKDNIELIVQYIYHCNVQPVASGEIAFKALCTPCGWAKFPIIHRIRELNRHIQLTFIFGSRSWIDRQPAFQIKYLLGDHRVAVTVIQGAGHHVYADRPLLFNELLCETLLYVDEFQQQTPSSSSSVSDFSVYTYDDDDRAVEDQDDGERI